MLTFLSCTAHQPVALNRCLMVLLPAHQCSYRPGSGEVVFVHLLHPCHSVSIDLPHFYSFPFHSFHACLENPSIWSCSLFGSYSLFLIILVSCVVCFLLPFRLSSNIFSPALSFMKFPCGSSQSSFIFSYSEYLSIVGKLCHLAPRLVFEVARRCVEHHGLLAEIPYQISTCSLVPHRKLIIYSTLYFVS